MQFNFLSVVCPWSFWNATTFCLQFSILWRRKSRQMFSSYGVSMPGLPLVVDDEFCLSLWILVPCLIFFVCVCVFSENPRDLDCFYFLVLLLPRTGCLSKMLSSHLLLFLLSPQIIMQALFMEGCYCLFLLVLGQLVIKSRVITHAIGPGTILWMALVWNSKNCWVGMGFLTRFLSYYLDLIFPKSPWPQWTWFVVHLFSTTV